VISISHKSKQYLLAALKVFILLLTFGYIYSKLTNSGPLLLGDYFDSLARKDGIILYTILFLLLAATNWIFEILKWKTIVSTLKGISFKTAMRQSLASLTVSLWTPNRIGDYGAKALFYKVEKRKQILLLNFFSNGIQMGITCVFGIIGLIYSIRQFSISFNIYKVLLFLLFVILLGFLGYYFKERQLLLKGLSIEKVLKYFKRLPMSVKARMILYSLIRYLVFCTMFYLLLIFFGVSMSIFEGFLIIFTMYLLVSIVPSIFIFDVVVRGGVAVWLFSMAGIAEIPVLSAVLTMWLLNFVIPALWGSFYVISFKTTSQ